MIHISFQRIKSHLSASHKHFLEDPSLCTEKYLWKLFIESLKFLWLCRNLVWFSLWLCQRSVFGFAYRRGGECGAQPWVPKEERNEHFSVRFAKQLWLPVWGYFKWEGGYVDVRLRAVAFYRPSGFTIAPYFLEKWFSYWVLFPPPPFRPLQKTVKFVRTFIDQRVKRKIWFAYMGCKFG